MTPDTPADDPGEAAGPDVTKLLALCLERISLGEPPDVDGLCAAHPERAEALRDRFGRLAGLGLLGDEGPHGGDDLPRQAVGPFTLVGLLGQGGMGRVYLGQQAQPVRRLAAVKLMHGGVDADRLLRRFEAERQTLALLHHPGIAQVLEAGATDDGRPWFAMEYVDGEPITAWCDWHALTLRDRLAVFLQVCDAVTHAHQSGILHRDLKPGNVLVAGSPEHPVVKVIDFGLAKARGGDDLEALQLTHAGQVVGTPGYMSPEQAGVTGEAVDLRTDVYALGVMLHELLVGRLPLAPEPGDRSPVVAMQRLLRDVEPERPSVAVTDLPEELAVARGLTAPRWSRALAGDLDWIVGKALAKDRDRRYAAVSELAADITRHLRHEPVLAGPPSTLYRLGRLVRRHRREAAIVTVALAGLATAIVTFILRLDRELDSFNVLARVLEVAALAEAAEHDLWPELPSRVPDMRAWRREVSAIVDETDQYRGILADLTARGRPTGDGLVFEQPRDGYLHAQVGDLLDALVPFTEPGGLIDAVDARIAWAEGLRGRTITARADAWDEAIAAIAAHPRYDGLQLAPQLGLVPLGPDPDSDLWEFAMPRPGAEIPVRGPDGRLPIREDTCFVFVLVPGGTFRQGAQDTEPEAPRWLPEVGDSERDGRLVTLEPFFLSKYEMTQAQWLRFTGRNPSHYAFDSEAWHHLVEDLTHPVEQVSWTDADRELGRLGLRLPTGAQWEWAARAGRDALWWTDAPDAPAGGAGNLADIQALRHHGRHMGIDDFDETYDDGRKIHAPVGRYAPNPFGLHDVIGNLWEWCRDRYHVYADAAPRPGDGLQVPLGGDPGTERTRELRGGSFLSTFKKARSTFRFSQTREGANYVFGVRPARAIDHAVD